MWYQKMSWCQNALGQNLQTNFKLMLFELKLFQAKFVTVKGRKISWCQNSWSKNVHSKFKLIISNENSTQQC